MVEKMDRKEYEEKQLDALVEFYKKTDINKKKICMNYVGLAGSIVMLALGVLLIAPRERATEVPWWILMVFACFTVLGYIVCFTEFRGDEKKYSQVHFKLKYMPISGKVMYRYIYRRMLKFMSILYVVLQVGQFWGRLQEVRVFGLLTVVCTFMTVWFFPMAVGSLFLRAVLNVKGEVRV